MKWYTKVWKVVKDVFGFIGKLLKKFFTLFNSPEKLFIFAYTIASIALLIKYNMPLRVIASLILNMLALIYFSFKVSNK